MSIGEPWDTILRVAARLRSGDESIDLDALGVELHRCVTEMPRPQSVRGYFFGVDAGSSAGHHLKASSGVFPHAPWPFGARYTFFGLPLDPPRDRNGTQPPRRECADYIGTPEPQSVGALHYRQGWTALGMWDRSADKRGGCNATFMFPGRLSFDEALAKARDVFPREVERIESVKPIAPWRGNRR